MGKKKSFWRFRRRAPCCHPFIAIDASLSQNILDIGIQMLLVYVYC